MGTVFKRFSARKSAGMFINNLAIEHLRGTLISAVDDWLRMQSPVVEIRDLTVRVSAEQEGDEWLILGQADLRGTTDDDIVRFFVDMRADDFDSQPAAEAQAAEILREKLRRYGEEHHPGKRVVRRGGGTHVVYRGTEKYLDVYLLAKFVDEEEDGT